MAPLRGFFRNGIKYRVFVDIIVVFLTACVERTGHHVGGCKEDLVRCQAEKKLENDSAVFGKGQSGHGDNGATMNETTWFKFSTAQ